MNIDAYRRVIQVLRNYCMIEQRDRGDNEGQACQALKGLGLEP